MKLLPLLFLLLPLTVDAQSTAEKIKVSGDIELIKLSDKAYMHVSYFETQSFGRVAANGLLLLDKGKAFLFDSPWNNEQTKTLVEWVSDSLRAEMKAFIPNHWHEDSKLQLQFFNIGGNNIKKHRNYDALLLHDTKQLSISHTTFLYSL